jgi:hypothetical protein
VTIPLSFGQISQPQVIQGGGAPAIEDIILQTLLQGMQQGQSAYQFAQQQKIAQGQLDIARQQAEAQTREQEMKVANARALGRALQSLLIGPAATSTPQPMGGPGQMMPDPSSALGSPGAMPWEMAPSFGASVPTTDMQPGGQAGVPSSAPFGQMGAIAQTLPPEMVPAFAEQARAAIMDREKLQEQVRRRDAIETAINSMEPAKQKGARAVLTFAEAGANLPKEMQQQLWPELFPADKLIDPQAMNAATTLFRTGVFTWGQARRQAGVPSLEGIPDDVKYVAPSFRYERKPTEQQNKARAQLTLMQSNAPILDAYSMEQAPGWLVSIFKGQVKSGWFETGANAIGAVSERDQQFLASARQFVDAWVRAVSGAQTNEQEFGRILRATIETKGDSEGTRQQKRNMRNMMMVAVEDIARGGTNITRESIVDRVLSLDWGAEQKKVLQEYKAKARKYDQDISKQRDLLEASGVTPGTSEDLEEQMAQLRHMYRTQQYQQPP